MADRVKLFSLTKKDFDIQTFRSGGPGGQHQNKSNTGVRIIHRASGAKGESRSERSQYRNRKLALQHLVATPEFKLWVKMKAGGEAIIEENVRRAMMPHNLRVEVVEDGRWVEE